MDVKAVLMILLGLSLDLNAVSMMLFGQSMHVKAVLMMFRSIHGSQSCVDDSMLSWCARVSRGDSRLFWCWCCFGLPMELKAVLMMLLGSLGLLHMSKGPCHAPGTAKCQVSVHGLGVPIVVFCGYGWYYMSFSIDGLISASLRINWTLMRFSYYWRYCRLFSGIDDVCVLLHWQCLSVFRNWCEFVSCDIDDVGVCLAVFRQCSLVSCCIIDSAYCRVSCDIDDVMCLAILTMVSCG